MNENGPYEPVASEALILIPKDRAIVQDLGAFRSGRLFETDLLAGSALVCHAQNGTPILNDDGKIDFAFEGNANDAVNLRKFHERAQVAAGRLASHAPSIAYGSALPEDVHVVAGFDLLRFVFTTIHDAKKIGEWSGEAVETFLPPAELVTPTEDPGAIGPLRIPEHAPTHSDNMRPLVPGYSP
ncbi:hypothetical protein ACOI1H_25960, partial [Loktanella sp. DJP18]|uniref:hypothetical protein n=1 Tax=Loktanella sp. DJP18 TaxID=3409788 RepID=UPI003BB5543B